MPKKYGVRCCALQSGGHVPERPSRHLLCPLLFTPKEKTFVCFENKTLRANEKESCLEFQKQTVRTRCPVPMSTIAAFPRDSDPAKCTASHHPAFHLIEGFRLVVGSSNGSGVCASVSFQRHRPLHLRDPRGRAVRAHEHDGPRVRDHVVRAALRQQGVEDLPGHLHVQGGEGVQPGGGAGGETDFPVQKSRNYDQDHAAPQRRLVLHFQHDAVHLGLLEDTTYF